MKTTPFARPVSLLLSALLLLGPGRLLAGICPEEASAPAADAAALRDDAAAKLRTAGLTAEEASARVSAMNEPEVAHVASGETEIRSGGSTATALLVVLLVVAIAYIAWDHMAYHRASY